MSLIIKKKAQNEHTHASWVVGYQLERDRGGCINTLLHQQFKPLLPGVFNELSSPTLINSTSVSYLLLDMINVYPSVIFVYYHLYHDVKPLYKYPETGTHSGYK